MSQNQPKTPKIKGYEGDQLSVTPNTTREECQKTLKGVDWIDSIDTQGGEKLNKSGDRLGCCIHEGETQMGS